MQSRQFNEVFESLNRQQREAVETIDGPVLVVAGPGTGKTQLIGARVGYILQQTDTPADAILLLTFTESGVQAMRERLNRLAGRAAYDIQISTYHAFGGEIFRRYPEYFEGVQLNLIEELRADSLLREIIAKLPYSSPLKFADNYINDLKSFISESKRALLSPDDIETIALNNLGFIERANKAWRPALLNLAMVSKKSVPIFEQLLSGLGVYGGQKLPRDVLPLARYAQGELESALDYFHQSGKTGQLTEWKKHWLAKNEAGEHIVDGRTLNERLLASAGLYRRYQQILSAQHLYDYDDMILQAIDALQHNKELKYGLAERYNYIMLDEFQDTNPAQFRLVELLTDHRVHEGRPNVLAVGDDDQAIYAFQGAEHANMALFAKTYRDVKVISLGENYRSQPEVIETSANIASQIQTRLHQEVLGVKKQLIAANKDLPEPPTIEVREFISDTAQHDWLASEIAKLVKSGLPPSRIAVLAPKHRYLEPLLPYLADRQLKVFYERRENVLDEPLIHQLEQMSRLVLALADADESLANSLWVEVLSYEFWDIPTERIWQINWQSRESHQPLTAILLNDENLQSIASFFLRLASLLPLTTLEQQLDILMGLTQPSEDLKLPSVSPIYEYYFSKQRSEESAQSFVKLISDLNVLRSRLREWLVNHRRPAGLREFIEFTDGYRAAGINILNTSPYHETHEAINLLTAYGAKGREFQAVFIVAGLDEVWGSSSRNQGHRIGLPANLSYIRYQGASEDERLRLLYVAVTRAMTRLYISSYKQDLAGKNYTRLKYLNIDETENGILNSAIAPSSFSKIISDESEVLSLSAARNYWADRHLPPLDTELKDVLAPRLQRYQLSATDLGKFIDIISYGPDAFFMESLLQFPKAPVITDAFGTAVHNSLRFAGNIFITEGQLPSIRQLSDIFNTQLNRVELPLDTQNNLQERGKAALKAWLAQRGSNLAKTDRFEFDFRNEGSAIGDVRLSGKVDRLVVDEKRRKITVVDYKTGKPYAKWQASIPKLHKIKLQIYFYKFLVESSARFRGYEVEKGIVEFVEPDESGRINQLVLDYEKEELKRIAALANAVWQMTKNLEFPNVSGYQPNLAGIREFEADLIKQNARG